MQRIKGALQILGGLGLCAFGITIGVAWVTFCFGTVVIGVLLLLIAPGVLLAPFTFGILPGTAMLGLGLVNFLDSGAKGDPEAAQRDMANGQGRRPTWAVDKSKCDQFLTAVKNRALQAGVPRKFIVEKCEDMEILSVILYYSGALEHHKCSFVKQQEEAAALLVKQWTRLADNEKATYGSQLPANA